VEGINSGVKELIEVAETNEASEIMFLSVQVLYIMRRE
jgi:hypothetical protein